MEDEIKAPPFGKENGRKPDLVCIGAQKAGTSWLHVVLAERPDIWVPPFKELHFFDHKFIEECRNWAPWHVKRGIKQAREKHLAKPVEPDQSYLAYLDALASPPMFNGNWYKGVYSRAPKDAVCLDVTPEYSCLPQEGVDFVSKYLSNAKFIYLIRHPLDRVLSQLRMNASRRKKSLQTRAEWMELADLPVMSSRGNYAEYIPRWQSAFDSERLLFIPYGLIGRDPQQVLQTVERFAGLPTWDYYKSHRRTIHGTYPVSLPDYVVNLMKERTQPQVNYLRERFGEDFLALTR